MVVFYVVFNLKDVLEVCITFLDEDIIQTILGYLKR